LKGRTTSLPTFRATLLHLVFLPSLLLLIGLFWAAGIVFEKTGELSIRLNARIAEGLASQVGDELKNRVHSLDRLSAVLEVTNSEDRPAAFQRLTSLAGAFEGVYLLDPGLIVRAQWPDDQDQIGNDFSGQEVLRTLGMGSETTWSNSFASPRTGRSTVSIARTFQGGVLLGNLNLDPLEGQVLQLAEGSGNSVALVDSKGTFLAHPDPEISHQRQPNLNYLLQRGLHGSGAFTYSEQSKQGVLLVSVQPLPVTGWAVLVSQPLVEIYQPLTPVLYLLIPLVLLFILGAVLMVVLMDRHLLGALATLRQQTEGLSRGEFDSIGKRTRYQDLNNILDSFETMRQNVWQREEDLRLGERRFRRMFEDAAIGIVYSSFSGDLFDLNQTMAMLLGYSSPVEAKAELKGTTASLYVRPEERGAILKMLQGTSEAKIKLTTEFYHRSGKALTMNLHLARIYDTQRGEFILETFAEDVTDLKIAEKAIRDLNRELEAKVLERTKHLEKALEDLGTAQTHLVHSEKMAALGQLIAGIAHELNTPLGAIHASNDTIAILLQRVLTDLPPLVAALPSDLSALQRKFYEAAARNLDVVPSITLRLRRREALVLLDQKGLKVDDETIDSLVELGLTRDLDEWLPLLSSPEGPAAVQVTYEMVCLEKSCAVIASASEKAAKVIQALRVFSHQAQENAFEKVKVAQGVETVLTLFQGRFKGGVAVDTKLDEQAQVWGLPDKLNQIWTNLISNSLQSMDDRGNLEVEVQVSSGTVRISVADNGPGIAPEIQSRIFEPFFTTKKRGEGSGLGLDISRKIVEDHHGRMSFESRPGRTVFYVELPSAP